MQPYTLADAEAELRAAIDADDVATMQRLEPVVDRLAVKPPVSLHAAALYYAEQGLHVFALTPGSKIPLPKCATCKATDCPGPFYCEHDQCHGFKDATTDTGAINTWWSAKPDHNIGIATGHLVDVIDIDGTAGQQSRLAQWDMLDAIPCLGKVSTPRPGGMHLYVPAAGQGNKAGLLPGIDYRGTGGYVVAPPSVNDQGAYVWTRPLELGREVTAA